MALPPHTRRFFFLPLLIASVWVSSCVAPLGPGYTIENQEIRVQFEPAPDPRIRVDATYQLRNTGTRAMPDMQLRLPGRRLFRLAQAQATWDGVSLAEQSSPANSRDTLIVFPQPWRVSENHTLHLSAEFQNPSPGQTGFSFSSTAFFLPSEGWVPGLLPSQSLFGTGGVPPKQWRLQVRVPAGFLVHLSGRSPKTLRAGNEINVLSVQHPEDSYPFVVAGLYKQTVLDAGKQKVFLWTRAQEDSASFRQSADALVRAIETYDAAFGTRSQIGQPFWFVDCPVAAGCFTAQESSYANLLSAEPAAASSELASRDTLMVDFHGGAPRLAASAPSLASSWLGYGQNPGFYEQLPPLSAFPAFAAALGEEAIEGPTFRTETIRRALRMIPSNAAARKQEDDAVLRAKSFLFFYALEERYGREVSSRAFRHMLSARRGRGFDLDDLIAAFEEETHQNVAEFVRLWMKRPGVPEDFRSHYRDASAAVLFHSRENTP
ncbi:MAG TPA: hypothetical protein VKH15_05435 [Candidatus Acidoferrum sp.]|nr:hypothetical protein [Candidatus Acidoferrum sp.]